MTDRTLEILPDAEAVARRAAEELAAEAHRAIRAIGRFTFAVSGGRSPWEMFRELAFRGRRVGPRRDAGDPAIPAGRVAAPRQFVIADASAASELERT